MKKLLGVSLATGMLLVSAAGVASAGEVTGNGRTIEVHGRSVCAFSGLDDVDAGEDPTDPTTDDFGRTQNMGQIVRYVGSIGGAGAMCRPGAEH